jgi:anthranilate/para-aminobenzoate synthase component II
MLSVLIVDNNDSFTYNLVELLRQTNMCKVQVCMLENVNEFSLIGINGVILSPGPGLPKEKQGLFEFIDKVQGKIPFLGVCLWHQAIFGSFNFSIKKNNTR